MLLHVSEKGLKLRKKTSKIPVIVEDNWINYFSTNSQLQIN